MRSLICKPTSETIAAVSVSSDEKDSGSGGQPLVNVLGRR